MLFPDVVDLPLYGVANPPVGDDDDRDRELHSASHSPSRMENFPAMPPPTSQEFAVKFEIYYRHFLPPPPPLPQTPIVKKTGGRAGTSCGRRREREEGERLGFYHKR